MIPAVSPQVMWGMIKVIHGHPRFKVGFLSLAGCATLRYVLWNVYQYWKMQRNIKAKKAEASERKMIAKEQCKDVDVGNIMDRDIEDLLNDLKSGDLTAEHVLKVFQKKALELDDNFNAITEPIMEALDRAKTLDKASDKTALLHGLPVSLKENIGISGYDSTGGMAYFLNKLMEDDAIVVKVLKKHGAIPFVRTNVPQTMMSFSSSNQIFGETSNPHDVTRSPGGSSSGEGALVGGGASFIGIGGDIGGSIRIPAAFNGCYGLKTTNRRISYKGNLEVGKGKLAIQPSIGPFAKDLKSLILLSKVLMSDEMYRLDPQLPYQPINMEKVNKTGSMKIGYYVFDGNVRCQPPVVRAVMESKAALERMGHTLIPIDLNKMTPGYDLTQLYGRIVSADRFESYKDYLIYEKLEKSMKFMFSLFMFPPWVIRKLGFLMSFKDEYAAKMLYAVVGFKSLREYFDHISDFRLWQERFLNSWMELKLDAMICPVFPSVAPKKDFQHLVVSAGCYCMLYNSLDLPSGVLPVTKVTKDDVAKTKNPRVYKPSLLIEKLLMKSVDGSEGMPVAIQCVALPFREETCLRVMREVETGLKK